MGNWQEVDERNGPVTFDFGNNRIMVTGKRERVCLYKRWRQKERKKDSVYENPFLLNYTPFLISFNFICFPINWMSYYFWLAWHHPSESHEDFSGQRCSELQDPQTGSSDSRLWRLLCVIQTRPSKFVFGKGVKGFPDWMAEVENVHGMNEYSTVVCSRSW